MLGRKKSETEHHKNGVMEFIPTGREDIEAAPSYRRYRGYVPKIEPNEGLKETVLSNPQNRFPGDVALFFQ